MDNYSNLLMDECPPDLRSPEDENKAPLKKGTGMSKGMTTSFGFKRRPATAPSVAGNPTAARRLANASPDLSHADNNGNTGDTESLTMNVAPISRTAPHRLPAPKKEAVGVKVSRFGFRQPNANRLNRVADINTNPPAHMQYNNNNDKELEKLEEAIKAKVEMQNKMLTDSNKNKVNKCIPGKFTLLSTQLPRPMPIKIIESKTAKTLANNNKKINSAQPSGDESSSVAEDSGVGSQSTIKQLDRSPVFRRSNRLKPRNLEVVVSGNTFDVRDLDESLEHNVSLSLPPLPSSFQRQNTGFVRDRTLEYQRNLDRKFERRNSFTSSEASSHYEEDMREKRIEKPKIFLKPRLLETDSSPQSSDDQMWCNAGEAMADEFSCSLSSSDESKDHVIITEKVTPKSITAALQSLMETSVTNSIPKNEIRNVILSIEDPKFAAVANKPSVLLEDETSPTDSLIVSYSEDTKKLNKSASSESKDVNEKLTISNPGSPTNASNSLSLSDSRDDFLIDDEIADQPALVFDDTVTPNTSEAYSNHLSDNTLTLIEPSPKPKRRVLGSFDGSPLVMRTTKRFLGSRTGSLDTLSPCESIASDDCMLDYEVSQSSGMEDTNDRTENNTTRYSLDSVRSIDCKLNESITRDWSLLLNPIENRASPKRLLSRPTRVLRSRAGTPGSNSESQRSAEGFKGKTAISQSPLRLSSRSSVGTGYDSDDSAIRVDRAQHCAMQQDVMSIKTMLLRLKRVLHEPTNEDDLLKSEAHNPLENGFFNGFSSDCDKESDDQEEAQREENSNLRRQIVYLQGQLEDRERTVHQLQEQMVKLVNAQESSQSAPASVTTATTTCNAATQTEKLRPLSTGPLLGSPADGTPGSLVSVSEKQVILTPPSRRSRGGSLSTSQSSSRLTPAATPNGRLWRTPGEAAPHRYPTPPSSIPRRSCSRTRSGQ